MGKVSGAAKPKRQYYDAEFKLRVVRDALRRPAGSRIKPTCRKWAGIEPVSDIPQQICARPRPKFCAPRGHPWGALRPPARRPTARADLPHPVPSAQVQLRKWIRNLAHLEQATGDYSSPSYHATTPPGSDSESSAADTEYSPAVLATPVPMLAQSLMRDENAQWQQAAIAAAEAAVVTARAAAVRGASLIELQEREAVQALWLIHQQ